MTNAELIAKLQTLPPDAEVFLQLDSAGNRYLQVGGATGDGIWSSDTRTMYSDTWSCSDADMPRVAWEAMLKEMPRCVVIFPK